MITALDIKSKLIEMGHQCLVNQVLTGSSGIKHKFDLLVIKGENRKVAIELTLKRKKLLEKILTLHIKSKDVGIESKVIVVDNSSEVNGSIKEVAKSLNIKIVDLNNILKVLS